MSQTGKSVALGFATETVVGKLVQFENRGRGTRAEKTDPAAKAEILIFTGVRYERQSGVTPTKPTASSGGKRKRG
jgi:hypothetical protein